jgi:hypothetical protein
MTEESNGPDGPKRFRSPPYPSLSLPKAIERAKQLYAKALHHAVGPNVLADAWEYGIKSSGLTTTAAALGQYDLLFASGSGDKRKYKLTDHAVRIIRDADPNSEKRQLAIQRAAMQPSIHRELWGKYLTAAGVHEIVVKNYLTLDRADEGKAPFSDAAADDIIRVYKDTIAFAGIGQSDTMSGSDGDKDDNDAEVDTPQGSASEPEAKPPAPKDAPSPTDQRREIKMMSGERELTAGLLSKNANFRLIVNGQVGVEEIERLIAKLEIDKEILADETVIMPMMGGQKALPVKATRLSGGRYRLTGNIEATADREQWDFRGPVVACKEGDADGMSGLIVVGNAPTQ